MHLVFSLDCEKENLKEIYGNLDFYKKLNLNSKDEIKETRDKLNKLNKELNKVIKELKSDLK